MPLFKKSVTLQGEALEPAFSSLQMSVLATRTVCFPEGSLTVRVSSVWGVLPGPLEWFMCAHSRNPTVARRDSYCYHHSDFKDEQRLDAVKSCAQDPSASRLLSRDLNREQLPGSHRWALCRLRAP